tara:strand:+ start:1641 stop:2117 length:477 start_codon:yes stop_codon:yes gene_type:complete
MNPFQVSEETLGQSSMQRGLPGMVSKVQPGPNMYDEGASSKPGVNSQLSNNERLRMQEMSRNIESAAPQANVGAARGMNSQVVGQADAESKAQSFATQRMSETLYANDSGTALMRLNSTMQSPDKDKFLSDIATGKAMAAGLNPDLGQEVAQKARYIR